MPVAKLFSLHISVKYTQEEKALFLEAGIIYINMVNLQTLIRSVVRDPHAKSWQKIKR